MGTGGLDVAYSQMETIPWGGGLRTRSADACRAYDLILARLILGPPPARIRNEVRRIKENRSCIIIGSLGALLKTE